MPKVEAKPMPKQPEQPRVDERLMKPGKYEVTSDHTFDVDLYLEPKGNRWVLVEGLSKNAVFHKITFRMWFYDEMVELRKLATSYDPARRVHMIDNDVLNRLKVQRLVVSWTFDRDNPRLKLHHMNGTLVDEAWQAFVKLQPNIIARIIEGMNDVLEFNG